MYVIMGGTGHVGSATADELLRRDQTVAIVTRDAEHADEWMSRGARVIEADAEDVASLRGAFRQGSRAFLLNPPAPTTTDTDVVERRRVANILSALEGAGLEKVVAESTGGARPGERIGDLTVLWEFEEGLRRQPIPAAINRAAYYMSNWDGMLEVARTKGNLPSMFPADILIPMVAPQDLGAAAAERLMSPLDDVGVRYVEGPRRYSVQDVAKAFSRALGRPVEPLITPRSKWYEAFRDLGFSEAAADAYTRMTQASVDSDFDKPADPWRGATSLDDYVGGLVA